MKPILEQIPLGKHKTISAFTYEKKNFETPWHFHPQNELTYIEESVGTKFIGDYVGAYAPGELVLLRSYLPHCWKNHSHSDKLSRSTVIQWNPDIIIELPELQSVSNMLNKASRGLIFSSEDTETLAPEILKLPYFHEAELYIELLRVLAKLASCPYATLSELSFQGDLPLEFNTRMTKVHDFVEKQFHRKIYLKELAALVNLSEQSFSRFFRKMMGRPFFTFLNEYRINMA
ncbi:MAG: AraC family transcriptional regulator, partial [Bacteroidota bacterium]